MSWSLWGLWRIQLLTAAEQIPAGIGPERSSVSVALQVVRDARGRGRPLRLKKELRGAVKDSYRRRGSKKARYRPKTKDKPSAGKPKVVMASAAERRKYRKILG